MDDEDELEQVGVDLQMVRFISKFLTPLLERVEELEKSNKAMADQLDVMRTTIKVMASMPERMKALPRVSRAGVVGNTVED